MQLTVGALNTAAEVSAGLLFAIAAMVILLGLVVIASSLVQRR
jgi:hypothetical protein